MPLMICAADRVIETTYGHTLEFKKDVPTHVPSRLVAFVMERGVFPVEGAEQEVAAATEPVKTAKQLEPTDPDVRKERIVEAIKALAAQDKLVYTAAGKPSPAPLSKAVGFVIDSAERDVAWEACKAEVSPS